MWTCQFCRPFWSIFQGFQQLVGSLCGVAGGGEQADELAADDGAGGVCLCALEGLSVADAKANHAGVLQLHGGDAVEVGLLGFVKGGLRAGGGGGADHIDEAVGVLVDEADALVAGLGCNQHDDAEVVAVGHGFVRVEVVAEWQVGNDHAVDAHLCATLAEWLESEVHDGVEVAHQDQWDADVAADVLQLGEQRAQGHAVAQCLCGCILYDGPVGHGVAEGYAHFYHVYAALGQGADDVGCAVQCGVSGAEIEAEDALFLCGKELVDSVHEIVICWVNVWSAAMSLRAGWSSKRELRSMPQNCGWRMARIFCASSGPMPPVSRKGVGAW